MTYHPSLMYKHADMPTTEHSKETFHLIQKENKPFSLFKLSIYSSSSLHHSTHQTLTSRRPPFLSHHHPHITQQKQTILMMNHQLLSPLPFLLLLLFSHSTTNVAQSPAAAPTAPATIAATPAPTPSSPPTDIIRILKKAGGFTTLIRLLQTTQVSNQINSQLLTSNGGLTLFAPNDNAFSSLKPGLLNSLNDQQKNELIQFHLLPQYISTSNFDTLSNPVRTQAGENPDRLALNVTSSGGNQVNMTTGIVNVTVGGTVYSDHQLVVYQVDKVLLPRDFFVAKPPAPAPAPEKSKGSKKKSAESDATAADGAESAAISLKQQRHVVAVVALLVAAFWW